MGDLIGPDIKNSILAHTVHVLLIGGVAVYGWQAVKALVGKPSRVGRALRKAVNGAWLASLLFVLVRPASIPSLRFVGLMASVMIVLAVFDKISAPAKGDELLTSGPAGVVGRDGERVGVGARVQRG